ncbi:MULTISPECIES: phycobiliprotein lyase [Planktothricoides]|uniref:Chromophore lyase CpcS/CpeS n=2 Tax=Planktothricoides raciborskii TaxID=132608 RepID=A0AAU8JFW6_9CYAN|nr:MULTISPECIES: phycobiliprotein lyase [Planktothricoides]KOR37280.1 chorismate-binding protein [Planktothricoides sp. SR001]MBD2542381.1 phycobiliprotein lyase [Planktothricoides raciborskii FACHB-1370]MBD2582049.1 phycobiliprotein lyase [Planktothricoides raciborskii FACHB-1261]
MDIIEFFEQSAGKWFSQRTSQHMAETKSVADSTDLWIDSLEKNDQEVLQLCQDHKVNPSLALCAVRVRWENKPLYKEPKKMGSTVLVAIASDPHAKEGKLLRKPGPGISDRAGNVSRFAIGNDNAVTITTESDSLFAEERLWFAGDNLRLRTSAVKDETGYSLLSFCSEIRMGGVKPKE